MHGFVDYLFCVTIRANKVQKNCVSLLNPEAQIPLTQIATFKKF